MSFARPAALRTSSVRWSRVGDVALFILFGFTAVGPIIRTINAISESEFLLACHLALSGGAAAIMAGLMLLRRQADAKATELSQRLVAIVGTFTITPLALLPMRWDSSWLLELTSVGFIVAYVWIIWALLTLRRAFSIFPEARGLVTHGPYALVRHPLYAAYFLTYTLVMIPRFSLVAVALLAIGITAEVCRSRNEERILRRTYPEYDDYARTVRAFVPIRRRA